MSKAVFKAAGIVLLAAAASMQAYAGVVIGERPVVVMVNSDDNSSARPEARLECTYWSLREGTTQRYLSMTRVVVPASEQFVAIEERRDGCPVHPFWEVRS